MKKGLLIILLIFAVIMAILFMNLENVKAVNRMALEFNSEYEYYNKSNLKGLDITTLINKAIDNNEKYEINKTENNRYIEDDKYSIKIQIKMKSNNKTSDMEQIYILGTEKFIALFGDVTFKCTNIEYHSKTGRISKMVFESEI